MQCPKCGAKMHQIFGEDDNEGYACMCSYYFWLDKGVNKNDIPRSEK